MAAMWLRCFVGLVITLGASMGSAQERLVPLPTPKRPVSQPARPRFIIGVYMLAPVSVEGW
jgi:hypothetical protein